MDTYIGTKIINAKPMSRLEYNKLRGWELPSDENGSDEGYLVEYTDGGKANHPQFNGYLSWSPKDVFERAYAKSDGLTFGHAIEALKQGRKVARRGWNGKGMYLWLLPEANVPSEHIREPHLKQLAEDNGGVVRCLPSIRMWTRNAAGDWGVLTGWLASQTDMISEDWYIVNIA